MQSLCSFSGDPVFMLNFSALSFAAMVRLAELRMPSSLQTLAS
jgi:hypothetical protein